MKKLYIFVLSFLLFSTLSYSAKIIEFHTILGNLYYDTSNENYALYLYDIEDNSKIDYSRSGFPLPLSSNNLICKLEDNGNTINAKMFNSQFTLINQVITKLQSGNFEGGSEKLGNEILKKNLYLKVNLFWNKGNGNGLQLRTFYLNESGISKDELIERVPKGLRDKNINFELKVVDEKCPNGYANSIKFNYEVPKKKDIPTKEIVKDGNLKLNVSKDNEEEDKKIGISENNFWYGGSSFQVEEIDNTITTTINGEVYSEAQDIKEISLIAHKLTELNNFSKAQNTIQDIQENLENKDITKNISFENGNTKVDIDVGNLEKGEIVWIYFPKEIAKNLSKIKFNKDDVIIRDKDPLVGWTIPNINYEIEGEVFNPGLLVIASVPIVYNSNNLIFNYRKESCDNPDIDETFLFAVENKSGGNIKDEEHTSFTAGKYNLCVSHLDESYKLKRVSSYPIGGFADDFNIFDTELKHYKLIVDELPPKELELEFSCLGSVNTIGNKFGDCEAFPKNRIWVYLGRENILSNPRVEIKEPFENFASDNVKFKLEVLDLEEYTLNQWGQTRLIFDTSI